MKEEGKNCFMLGKMNEGRREQIIWTDVERRDFMMKTRKMNVNTMNKTKHSFIRWNEVNAKRKNNAYRTMLFNSVKILLLNIFLCLHIIYTKMYCTVLQWCTVLYCNDVLYCIALMYCNDVTDLNDLKA